MELSTHELRVSTGGDNRLPTGDMPARLFPFRHTKVF